MAVNITSNKNWSDYEATSSTSVTLNNGATTAITMLIEQNKAFQATDEIALVPSGSKIPMMLIGTITAYNSSSGQFTASINRFESNISSWDLTSATPVTVGTGSKTFITYNNKNTQLSGSDIIMVARQGTNGANRMYGTVTSYNNADGTLIMSSSAFIGSGTNLTDWVIVNGGTFNKWDIVPPPTANINIPTNAILNIDKEPKYPVGSFVSLDRGQFICQNTGSNLWVIELSSRNINGAKNFQLNNNGYAKISGSFITIYVGNGQVTQSISLTGSYAKLDHPAILVESASGSNQFLHYKVYEDNATPRGYLGKNYISRGYKCSFAPLTSSIVTTATSSNAVITSSNHNLNIGQKLRFNTTGTYNGATIGSDYFIIDTDFTTSSFRYSINPFNNNSPASTIYTGTLSTITVTEFGGNNEHGYVCLFNPTTRTLRFGNGIVGAIIPSGSRVIIPNIHLTLDYPRTSIMSAISSATAGNACVFSASKVSNLATSTGMTFFINKEEFTGTFAGSIMTSTTRAVNGSVAANHAQGDTIYCAESLTGTTTNNRGIFDLAGGILDINTVSLGNTGINTSNHQGLNINNVFQAGGISFGNTTATTNIKNFYMNMHPQAESGMTITSCLGDLSIENISNAATCVGTNQSTTAISINNNQSIIKCNNIMGFNSNRNGTSAPNLVNFQYNIFKTIPSNINAIGGRITFQNSSQFEIDTIKQSSESNGIPSANIGINGIVIANCQNGILRNISKLNSGSAVRNQLISTDANCSNMLFHTINYDSQLNCAGVLSGQGNNIRVVNGNFGTFRTSTSTTTGDGFLANSGTGDTINGQNLMYAVSNSYGPNQGCGVTARCFLEYCGGHSMWWRQTGSLFDTNYQEMGPYHVLLDSGSKASGVLTCQFSPKADRDIYTLSGSAYMNNGGGVVLPSINDSIIIKSYQNLRTINGFTGSVVAEPNTGSYAFNFELVGNEQNYINNFIPLTTNNLSASLAAILNYDSNKGFKIQTQIIATSDLQTNPIMNIRMFTLNDPNAYLPIGNVNYTINNIYSSSSIAVYSGSNNTEVFYSNNQSGSFIALLPYDYIGIYRNYPVKIRSYLSNWDDHNVNFNQYDLSHLSNQTLNTQITEPNMLITSASLSLSSVQNIYDYVSYYGTLRNNLTLNRLCQKTNNNLDFGNYNLLINASASSVLSVFNNDISIKANAIDTGSITTTGTISFLSGSYTGTTTLTGNNGASSILILTGLISSSVYVQDNSLNLFDYKINVNGTYSIIIPFGSSGTWKYSVKRQGYRHAIGNFTPSSGGIISFTPSNPIKLNPDGSNMYTGTSSSLCQVSFNGISQANIDIGNGTPSLQAVFDTTEDALITLDGMKWLISGYSDCSQFNSAGGDYLFMSTLWRLRRWNTTDVNATMNSFVIGADGAIVDGINGGVQFLTSDSPTAIASAVRVNLALELSRIDDKISTAVKKASLAAALSA